MLRTSDYLDTTSVTDPISEPAELPHSQLELGKMKVFPQLFLLLQATPGSTLWSCYLNPYLQQKHWSGTLHLFGTANLLQALLWPRGQKDSNGRNHQKDSLKWINEIHFPPREGLLECNENKPHPSSPVHTHTHPRGFCKATGTEIILFESIKH